MAIQAKLISKAFHFRAQLSYFLLLLFNKGKVEILLSRLVFFIVRIVFTAFKELSIGFNKNMHLCVVTKKHIKTNTTEGGKTEL